MSRASALARLAAAYGRHQVRGRFRRPEPGAERLLEAYAGDRLFPLSSEEREVVAGAGRCINCGLCALVAARVAGLRPADLGSAYLRDYPRLAGVSDDWSAESETGELAESLAAAAAACPTGVPLPELLATVRRLASR